ncbi:hypothetical protein [Brevundimonas sp. A19_0]|uniref:hypothetical protein n=1 Tax=Brevundimonas sp. A19_0 TaxID=2821087 RepID=UPI001ADBDA1D|nr:hypothetical protein [Brevundimonas sp. A19_0]MBO9501638.1 hypothetical protein [Brevundimonas sp. A19_0]
MRCDAPAELPRFFIPFAGASETAEEVYESVRAFMRKVAFAPNERRIYSVAYRHNGRDYVSTVGEREPEGETVIAIFETFNPDPLYMICTRSRGVVTGDPILAGDAQVVVDFAPGRQGNDH